MSMKKKDEFQKRKLDQYLSTNTEWSKLTKKEKNKIIVKLKNFNFLDLNTNEVNAILYDENFSTLRTTNVENNKNNLLFTK